MSLIIDAIQKAQQLRVKEVKATPFFKNPGDLRAKRAGRPWKWIWIPLSASVGISLLLFLLASHSFPLLASHRSEKISPAVERMEKKEVPIQEPLQKKIIPTSQIPEPPAAMETLDQKREDEPPVKQPIAEKKGNLSTPWREGRGSPKVHTEPRLVPRSLDAELHVAKGVKVPKYKKTTAERELAFAPGEAHRRKDTPVNASAPEEKKEKDRDKAVDILTNFNLGVSLYHQREIPRAIEAYKGVIELDPTYVEAYNNLGVIYQDMGDFGRALEAYRKSIQINPRYEKGYNNVGILLYLRGEYREAIEAFEKALAINANNTESYINLGILSKKEGQMEKAIECYQKALHINPLHGEAHYNIGLLYEQLDNVEFAIGHYQQFARLASKTHPELVSKVQRHLNYLMATKGK